jgi:CelD/BcsL family acetyltransferase involved in cellulose biosynthesis
MSGTPQVRRDAGVFEDLASWWNQCPGPQSTPFLRSEWFAVWSDSFLPAGSDLEVVVWTEGEEPVAILPLSRKGLRRSALANSHSEVFDVVMASGAGWAPAIQQWLGQQPVTRFFRLDGESSLVPGTTDPRWYVDRRDGSPYTDLSGGPEFATSILSRGLVKNLRRLERRLGEVGELIYLDNADGSIPDLLGQCMRLEAAGWKGEAGTAMISRTESARFYEALIDLARDRGWLRICALLVAERLAAFEIDLDYGGSRFSLKAGYDEELARYSPGKLLQYRVIRTAASLGLSTYEIGGVAEPWKMEWAHDVRPRLNALRFADSGPNRLLGSAMRTVLKKRSPGGGESAGISE